MPYPKFLVMFENNATHKPSAPSERINSGNIKVDDTEIEKVILNFILSDQLISDIVIQIKKSLSEIIVSKLSLIQQVQ